MADRPKFDLGMTFGPDLVCNNLLIQGLLQVGTMQPLSDGQPLTINGNLVVNGTINGEGLSVLIGQQVFGSVVAGTYTPTPGTKRVRLRMTGAGGGGGAAQTGGAGTASFGGGGSSGTYLEAWIDPGVDITGGAITGGAGGAGGVGGVGAGGTGPDATIIIQGVTYTAKGGPGGLGMPTGVAANTTADAWLAVDTSGPSQFISSSAGSSGDRWANGVGRPGRGGSNPMGGGGASTGAIPAAGGNARGSGGGGGGAIAWNTGDQAGGNGSGTLIIVQEYS